MELRRELLLTMIGLVVLNLLLAFGSIGLFMRMGPAIDRILQENVYSISAAEEILAELASFGNEPLPRDGQLRVRESLQRAKRNVTEDQERPVLTAIETHLAKATSGDLQSRRKVISELRQLIRINRNAMSTVDEEARRLGNSGAWAAVLLGFLSFVLSLIVAFRFQRRIIHPLEDLHEVLQVVWSGDRLRRCRSSEAPLEILKVQESINRLLDERLQGLSKMR